MDDYSGPYVRTQGTQGVHVHSVHKPGCGSLRHAKTAEPWSQVDGRSPEQIRRILATVGLTFRWCRYCFGGMRGGI